MVNSGLVNSDHGHFWYGQILVMVHNGHDQVRPSANLKKIVYQIKYLLNWWNETSSIEVLILFDNVSSDSAPTVKFEIYLQNKSKISKTVLMKKLQVSVNES